MGVYSQMDAELRYGGNIFVDDEANEGCPAFVPDDTEDGDTPAFEDDDDQEQEPVPAPPPASDPAPSDGQAQTEAQPATKETAKAAADEDAKRKAHEEAEAKRKAEWEAKQAQKKVAEQKKLDELAAMSDEELMTASTQRVGTDIEKLTRRNMKECVAEHIQTMCLDTLPLILALSHGFIQHLLCFVIRKRQLTLAVSVLRYDVGKYGKGVSPCALPSQRTERPILTNSSPI